MEDTDKKNCLAVRKIFTIKENTSNNPNRISLQLLKSLEQFYLTEELLIFTNLNQGKLMDNVIVDHNYIDVTHTDRFYVLYNDLCVRIIWTELYYSLLFSLCLAQRDDRKGEAFYLRVKAWISLCYKGKCSHYTTCHPNDLIVFPM